jgi:hypothetical protein
MGIVNDELNLSQDRVCNYTKNCSYSMLSCRYLTFLKDNIIQVFSYFNFSKFFYQINLFVCVLQIPFETVPEAMEAGKRNDVWGVIHFGHNFTKEFEIRQNSGDSASFENIIGSQISVNMDSTSKLTNIYKHLRFY